MNAVDAVTQLIADRNWAMKENQKLLAENKRLAERHDAMKLQRDQSDTRWKECENARLEQVETSRKLQKQVNDLIEAARKPAEMEAVTA